LAEGSSQCIFSIFICYTLGALGHAEGCWFEPQSDYIKCGIFTVHLNSYVVLVVQCLGLGPNPFLLGWFIPVGRIAFGGC